MSDLNDLIYSRLEECHATFPSFNDRAAKDLDVIARVFERHLADWSLEDVAAAFDTVTGRFPVPDDILAFKEKHTAYQFEYGPLGFGAIYSEDHPYTRTQMRNGLDISAHRIECTAREAKANAIEAKGAPRLTFDPDDLPTIERGGSGFRRVAKLLPANLEKEVEG